ncbi:MAG: transposase zinc-binding domain-containing protein [Deltaproteobacteria bacterium]|nr:transposase zinc-binding domain-containing protein [Deltaproteobacteria bacterium]
MSARGFAQLAAYLRCGILAHAFARVRCQTCRDEIVVAFSCKRRRICPSCTARDPAYRPARGRLWRTWLDRYWDTMPITPVETIDRASGPRV